MHRMSRQYIAFMLVFIVASYNILLLNIIHKQLPAVSISMLDRMEDKKGLLKPSWVSEVPENIGLDLVIDAPDATPTPKPTTPSPSINSEQRAPLASNSKQMATFPVVYSSYFEEMRTPEPRMLSGADLEFWYTKQKLVWGGVTGEMWHGFNFSLPIPIADCGMRATRGDFIVGEGEPCLLAPEYARVVVALAPEAWSWQHFMQDIMPKVWFTMQAVGGAQAMALRPFMLPPARDSIVLEILEYLHLSYVEEPTYPLTRVCVSNGIITCKIPGMHPRLWKGVHSLLSVPPVRPPDIAVLLSRKNARNGRQDTNFDELQSTLERDHVPFSIFEGGSLREVQTLFSRAYMVIGSHGGGFMNIFFAPQQACVIEHQEHGVLMGTTVQSNNAEMFYVIATGIGQPYWRLVANPDQGFAFDVDKIAQAVAECHQLRATVI
jgi:Glycosyltransferase 61